MEIHIRSWSQYQTEALRTESLDYGNAWQSAVPQKLFRVLHALLGISTELAELQEATSVPQDMWDLINIKEELGDLWWYMALLIDAAGPVNSVYEVAGSPRDLIFEMHSMVGESMDVIKRRLAYGSDDSDKKASWHLVLLSPLFNSLLALTTKSFGFDKYEVWEANIRKLYSRYPEKFSSSKAINRDLYAEREALS